MTDDREFLEPDHDEEEYGEEHRVGAGPSLSWAETMVPTPSPGRVVTYQTDERGGHRYWLSATVTITRHNWVSGDGSVPYPASDYHVHLLVNGPTEVYPEFNVPYDEDADARSWRWPERV